MTTSPSRRPRSGRPRPRRNWSGAVRFTPHEILAPTSEDEVTAALREARSRGLPLRVIGGGHSFSPLVATDGLLLTLDGYQGLVRADPATGLVTLRGGTRLWSVAELLAPHGLALETMGTSTGSRSPRRSRPAPTAPVHASPASRARCAHCGSPCPTAPSSTPHRPGTGTSSRRHGSASARSG
ncbi:FAD-binding protein [Brachybacterium paraconglomeratum]